MNLYFVFAALLCLFGAGFHIIVGNRRIDNVIFATALNIRVRTISRIVWHFITTFLSLCFCFLIYGAFKGIGRDFALFLSLEMFSMAGLFLFFCGRHLNNPFQFPHPFVFTLIGVLVIFGAS